MEKNWFTVKKLYPQVWGIAEFGHNEKVISYLFVGKNKALLFDSGMGIGDIKKVVDKITKLPVIVVNSHCHFDHIGGNIHFKNVLLYDDPFSRSVAKNGHSDKSVMTYITKELFEVKPPVSFNAENYHSSQFSFTKLLNDGDIINVFPFEFEVIHTPGHTPDSICLYEKKLKMLLTGDTLYMGPIYLQFKESNYRDYVKSIFRLSSLSIRQILPGHNTFKISPRLLVKIRQHLVDGSLSDRGKNVIQINDKLSIILR